MNENFENQTANAPDKVDRQKVDMFLMSNQKYFPTAKNYVFKSYHSQLKRFMKSFNGVSTKYLNNYLIWHNFVNYAKESDVEKRAILLSYVLTTLKTDRNSSLSDRPALPLVA